LCNVGGRTLARRKPYRKDTRKPSKQAISERICKNKAITKELKHARTKYNYKAKTERINKQQINNY